MQYSITLPVGDSMNGPRPVIIKLLGLFKQFSENEIQNSLKFKWDRSEVLSLSGMGSKQFSGTVTQAHDTNLMSLRDIRPMARMIPDGFKDTPPNSLNIPNLSHQDSKVTGSDAISKLNSVRSPDAIIPSHSSTPGGEPNSATAKIGGIHRTTSSNLPSFGISNAQSIRRSGAAQSGMLPERQTTEKQQVLEKINKEFKWHVETQKIVKKPQFTELLNLLTNKNDDAKEVKPIEFALMRLAEYFEELILTNILDHKSKFYNTEFVKALFNEELESIRKEKDAKKPATAVSMLDTGSKQSPVVSTVIL